MDAVEHVGFDEDPMIGALLTRFSALPVGSRLPSERELAQELGVSRTAMRDRLQALEALGVLERRIGSGTYTKAISHNSVSAVLSLGLMSSILTVDDLRPVRLALERQAAGDAARSHDETPSMFSGFQ